MIDLTGYDYVDFGCSSGGSMIYARDHLGGGRGVGIDLDAKKVAATVSRGFDAVVGDLSAAPSFHGNVRFSMCSHFLEHVSDLDTARRCLDTALSISREYVYIQHPWFDADAALRELGLKLFWSDWRGHPNCITSGQLLGLLDDLSAHHTIESVTWGGRRRIETSDHEAVHPLASARDQFDYDAAKHPPKSECVEFAFPVYREIVAIVAKVPVPIAERRRMARATDLFAP